ncbi:MAG TPA: heparinase II/III family protein [Tepidisphaeraceae bacterium]|jgi:hypothetical protein|nr:heparinase II/III family protein [Tepidisphaeraceae bacterium]
MRIWIVAILLCCSSVFGDDLLSTLRKEHPRLLVLADDFPKAKQNVMRDPRAGVYYKQIVSDCAKFLAQKPVTRGQGEMLNTSRTAFGRITFLAALYRMDGDPRFAQRARQEMLAAAKFPDWNPPHFLDTAEMTAAMAIGYDWLFDALSPEDRATIRTAIIEKGLNPGLAAYKSGEWWTKVDYNWANVCSGGLALGALAIADEEPDLARQVLETTRHAMDKPLKTLAPDGGCLEGPAYWDYGTRYTVFYLAALQTALGNDLGMDTTPGLDKTGFFRIYTNGPTDKAFNFADSSEFAGIASQMFWLAHRFNQPAFAISEREYAAKWGDAFHLLWWNDQGTTLTDAKLPLDAIFRKANVATFRGAWDDPGTFYVGFKGGDNTANHSHLDLGSFVLDAFAQRWAIDLGSDNYSLPDYFGKLRFSYYRTRTEGHNTLVIDDQNQDSKMSAPIVAFSSSPERAFAVADMSAAYHWRTSRVVRGIELLNRSTIVVEDEVETPKPVKVQWNLHTPAQIKIAADKLSADLTLGGQNLSVKILSPADAQFDIISAAQPKPQNENKGIQNLIVSLSQKTTKVRIIVVFASKRVIDNVKDVPPLDDWIKQGALNDAQSH